MLATIVVNTQLNKIGLPQQVVGILEKELGWVRVLDVLVFLSAESQYAKSRPHNISALERKLLRTNGLWVKRTKQIIDALMAHDIL